MAVGLFALLNHSILKTLMNKIEKVKLKDVMTKQHIKIFEDFIPFPFVFLHFENLSFRKGRKKLLKDVKEEQRTLVFC